MCKASESLILGLWVAACATHPAGADGASYTPAGMAWSYNLVEGQGATLSYGKAETDDVPVIMTCRPHSRRIELSVAVGTEHPRPQIELTSGEATSRLRARYEEDALGPGLVAHATPHDPALRRFAETGRLEVRVTGQWRAVPASDPAAVRKFLAVCG